ncbi:MAG: hypothetical protein A4E63_00805 [Syntrophorhabdus sp. PtaU1.Bin050]|jgi:RNase H-fold protein (predicted Holliday junction resolvase)|nr:MAG: hypothetical protein A4E63_00805 [Syntrophorhabdus sp. PtaU1.Bin050]
MLQQTLTILAVNPGTKYIGVAILQDSDLVYWGVKVLKGKWSDAKMKNAEASFNNFINQYHVDILTIKKLHPSRSSGNLDVVVIT